MPHILLLPGDGIGSEVMAQATLLLDWCNVQQPGWCTTETALIGGASIDRHGTPLTDAVLERARAADAALLGAVGGPAWDHLEGPSRPESGLLAIRKGMGLFANLRPALVFPELVEASTLKREVVEGLDLMIVRELTGDLYFGTPRGITTRADGVREGVNTMRYDAQEVARIAEVAFALARVRSGRVCSVDKANVLECTALWRTVVQEVHVRAYSDVALTHMYVDNAAMQLVRAPKQFDVVVTGNMFGDILSDCAAMVTGSLGMLPSASLGAKQPDGKQPALYEPVHGSAPDIAGHDRANPLAMMLSVGMMLRYSFGKTVWADAIEHAIRSVLASGIRTGDILQPGTQLVGTQAMGRAVLDALSGRSFPLGA